MPTPEQLFSIWEMEFNNPWTRRTDDPMYISPERFIELEKQRERNEAARKFVASDDNKG